MLISSEKKNNICAVIPFFNEEQNINNVISRTLKFVDKLILVDDGSTDSSVEYIPQSDNIILLSHDSNKGKGSAILTGLKKSIDINCSITLTLDADGQHDPDDINLFLNEIKNADCIIGARMRDPSIMPIHRRMSNLLTSKLLTWKTGAAIKDSQCGYRAFRTSILKCILPTYAGFEAESEMIVKICRNKLKLTFVDIPTIYGDDNSKMRAIPTIIGFIKVLLKS